MALTKTQQALFDAIKTKLAKQTALARLEGLSYEKSYLKSCKRLKKKPSKNPKRAGQQIVTNSYVAAFIKSIESPAEIDDVTKVIASRDEKRDLLWENAQKASESQNFAAATSAIAELNKMDGDNAPDRVVVTKPEEIEITFIT